jgi:hypothetical protein
VTKRLSGGVDSKYYYNPHQLDEDLTRHKQDAELFKSMLRQFILLEPSKLDLRYHDAIDVLREIKKGFGL